MIMMLVLTLQMGKMLYNTAAGTTVTQDALMQVKTKKYAGSILPKCYITELGRTIKTLIYQLTAMEPQGVYNGKKAQRFAGENIEDSVATDFDSNNTGAANPAPFNQVPVASTYYLESGDFFKSQHKFTTIPVAENSFLNYCKMYKPFSSFSPELNGNVDPR
jgi:hypothetical protein